MADNDQLLKQIGSLIDTKLQPIKKDLQDVKQSQAHTNAALAQTNTSIMHMKTTIEALAAGQQDIREALATKADKADIQDLKAEIVKRIKDHEERIKVLEHEAGLPHPHKH